MTEGVSARKNDAKKKKRRKKKRNAAIVFFFPSFCRASATVMTNCFFQERLDLFSGLKAVFFFFGLFQWRCEAF